MRLAGVQQVRDGRLAPAQRVDDALRLRRRHDRVFSALEYDQRRAQAVEVVERRARIVDRLRRRQWPDQRIEVAALELVGVLRQRGHVGHTVVVGAGAEHVGGRQRHEHGVAAGAATADRGTLRVGTAARRQVMDGGDDVLDVDHAPVAVQALPVGATEAGTAAVIDVDDGKTAGGPELDRRRKLRSGIAGRTAVHEGKQRRTAADRRPVGGISRGIKERMGGTAAGARILDGLGDRQRIAVESRRRYRAPEDVGRAAAGIDLQQRARPVGSTGQQHRMAPVKAGQLAVAHVRQVEFAQVPGGKLQHGQPVAAGDTKADEREAAIQQRVVGLSQGPQRRAELGGADRDRAHCTGTESIQVPEVGAVGQEVEIPAVTPLRLEDRLVVAAGDDPQIRQARRRQLRDHQPGRVPGHVRMVPGDESDVPPVGAWPRIGNERRPSVQHLARTAGRGIEADDGVARFAAGHLFLAYAHEHRRRGTAIERTTVGVAETGRGDRAALPAVADFVQALVIELAVENPPARQHVRRATVLVDAAPHVGAFGGHFSDVATRLTRHQGDAAAFARPVFGPVDAPARGPHVVEPGPAGSDVVSRQRRCPAAVRGGHGRHGRTSGAGRTRHQKHGQRSGSDGHVR